jgi:hypothetical protein
LPSRALSTRCSTPPATAELAQALRHALDPVAFAVDRLGFQPDPWQASFLRSSAPRTLLNVSRQAGKSTSAAILALHLAMVRPGALILLVSPSLRQSAELFKKLVEFRRRLDPPPVLVEDNQLSCTFQNGSRVVSLPGSEATTRGYSAPAAILVDEASRVEDALFLSLRPMMAVAVASRLVLMSTPYGQRGFFWQAWHQGGDDWERVRVPAAEIPRISSAFLAAERRALGEAWFAQEYEGRFVAAADTVFRPEDIARAISGEVEPLFADPPTSDDLVPLFPPGGP